MPLHLARRKTQIAVCAGLYFNVFVLVVQSFEKVPSLKAIAPTQKEAPFAVAQIGLLLLFLVLTIFAVKRFRVDPPTSTRARPASGGFCITTPSLVFPAISAPAGTQRKKRESMVSSALSLYRQTFLDFTAPC